MEKEELDRLIDEMRAKAMADADREYEGVADDGFEIARALLHVLGDKFGLGFVLDVQREVVDHAQRLAASDDPHRRADAVEVMAVANAGYFTDLIDDLADDLPSGHA